MFAAWRLGQIVRRTCSPQRIGGFYAMVCVFWVGLAIHQGSWRLSVPATVGIPLASAVILFLGGLAVDKDRSLQIAAFPVDEICAGKLQQTTFEALLHPFSFEAWLNRLGAAQRVETLLIVSVKQAPRSSRI